MSKVMALPTSTTGLRRVPVPAVFEDDHARRGLAALPDRQDGACAHFGQLLARPARGIFSPHCSATWRARSARVTGLITLAGSWLRSRARITALVTASTRSTSAWLAWRPCAAKDDADCDFPDVARVVFLVAVEAVRAQLHPFQQGRAPAPGVFGAGVLERIQVDAHLARAVLDQPFAQPAAGPPGHFGRELWRLCRARRSGLAAIWALEQEAVARVFTRLANLRLVGRKAEHGDKTGPLRTGSPAACKPDDIRGWIECLQSSFFTFFFFARRLCYFPRRFPTG